MIHVPEGLMFLIFMFIFIYIIYIICIYLLYISMYLDPKIFGKQKCTSKNEKWRTLYPNFERGLSADKQRHRLLLLKTGTHVAPTYL